LALFERLVARAADRGVVHENVARAIIRGDQAVALFRVEPLHSSLRHACSPRALSARLSPAEANTPADCLTGGMRFYPVACHSDTRRRATTSEQYRLTHTHRQQTAASKVREFGAALSRHCRPREDWR